MLPMTIIDEKPAYIRLLNLLNAIRELSPFEDLSADEEQLLGYLAIKWHEVDQITVSDIMQEAERVSPSTMYRRLIGLRDKGFIKMPTDKEDRRSRFVVPTAASKKYMSKLEQCVYELAGEKKG